MEAIRGLFYSSHEPFQYPKLDVKLQSFRLIKILPPKESLLPLTAPTLRIQICETTIGNPDTAYNTLSYCWGACASRPDRLVIVETAEGPRSILIFRPLEAALLALANSQVATALPIFVDQLCINQGDSVEKGSQVQLMGDIYSGCQRVIVWLGPETKGSNAYFDYVAQVSREGILSRFMQPRSTPFGTIFDAVMDAEIAVDGTDREDRDDILSLLEQYGSEFPVGGAIDVLQRQWFTRLWIIQEACLGRDVLFVCGSRSICLDCFSVGMLFFTLCNTYWTRTVTHSVSKRDVRQRKLILQLNQQVIRIIQERRAIHTRGEKEKFSDLVLKYNVNDSKPKVGASLPEDRLFGLLGIAREEKTMRSIEVEYGNTARVFTRVAAALIRENPDFIGLAQNAKRLSNLPSWVPDWSADLSMPHGYLSLTEPVYSAGGVPGLDEVKVDLHDQCLTLRGVIVDEIKSVGEQSMRKDDTETTVDDINYPSASLFFAEADQFLFKSSQMQQSILYNVQDDRKLQIKIRLSDFGLTAKHFADERSGKDASNLVTALHEQTAHWGGTLLNVQQTAASHRPLRLLELIDYKHSAHWAPPSEMDILTSCARDPATALLGWSKGLLSCLLDISRATKASLHLSAVVWYLRTRRRFAGVTFSAVPGQHRSEVVQNVGLDPEISLGDNIRIYQDNLLRNAGQSLYLTNNGRLGTGPSSMRPGDAIAIFLGATVPHVIRRKFAGWTYLGEAYCEGIMHGEILQEANARVVDICLE